MPNPKRGAEQVAEAVSKCFRQRPFEQGEFGYNVWKFDKELATTLIQAAIDEAVGEMPTILRGLVSAVDEFKRQANPAMSGKELAAFAAICHFTIRAHAALNQEKEGK